MSDEIRTPSRLPDRGETVRQPDAEKDYDIRALDQFYAYCRALAALDAHRRALARSRRWLNRIGWKLVLGAAFLGFLYWCLLIRAAQTTSL
jgi:amino acid transporter